MAMPVSESLIRDVNYVIIGILQEMDDGTQILKSFPSRQIIGEYWPQDDTTRDFSLRIIGRGNILTSLLHK
jgi:hypothetical protein